MAYKTKVIQNKSAEAAMDEMEEAIFTYLDGLMFHHLSQQKAKAKHISCKKSKIEFSIAKDGEFKFGLKGAKPYSEEAVAYERKDFENVMMAMEEVEPSLKPLHECYKECMKAAKDPKAKVPDHKKAIAEAAKILKPYSAELEKIYQMEKVV